MAVPMSVASSAETTRDHLRIPHSGVRRELGFDACCGLLAGRDGSDSRGELGDLRGEIGSDRVLGGSALCRVEGGLLALSPRHI